MSRFILLDTNMLIGVYDPEPDNLKHAESQAIMERLLEDNSVKFAITPLIRYEVLRKIERISVEDMINILDDFEEFDIKAVEANRAAAIYSAMYSTDKLNKRAFDVFHYVASEVNDLELLSNDGDIAKIKQYLASNHIATQIQT